MCPEPWLRVPGIGLPARRWGCRSARAAAEPLRLVPHARLGAADPGPCAAPRPQRKPLRGEERRGGLLALHERPCRFAPPSHHQYSIVTLQVPKGSPHASVAPSLACGAVNRSPLAHLMSSHRRLRIRPRGYGSSRATCVSCPSAAPPGAASVETRALDVSRGRRVTKVRFHPAVAPRRPGARAAGRVARPCRSGFRRRRRPARAAASRAWLT